MRCILNKEKRDNFKEKSFIAINIEYAGFIPKKKNRDIN